MRLTAIFGTLPKQAPEALALRRRGLVRLGLAWLAMMQVMMFALPGYLRHEASGQDSLEMLDWAIVLMNWASLTLTVPVVLYSAWPIWCGCMRALSERCLTMDVPVGISMLVAFVPSVFATLRGVGEVYFDSITMFVAFLLTARYLEYRLRSAENLAMTQTIVTEFSQPLLRQANRVATLFVCIQLVVAVGMGSIWWMIAPALAWPVLVSLLVMSCPCALSLAAPVSIAALQIKLLLDTPLTCNERAALLVRTHRIAHQNLYGALAWHVLTMPLAALGWVTPWLAALSMFFSSIVVVLNAWRLSRPNRTQRCQTLPARLTDDRIQT